MLHMAPVHGEMTRLGRSQIAPRIESGLPVGLLLTWAGKIGDIRTIPAIIALLRRGVLLRAKRAVEAMVAARRSSGRADAGTGGGWRARGRLGLTQEQFAVRYGLDIGA